MCLCLWRACLSLAHVSLAHVSFAHDDLTRAHIQTDALVHLNAKIDTPGKPCMMMEVEGEVQDNEGEGASDADVCLLAPLCMNASMVNTSSEIR